MFADTITDTRLGGTMTVVGCSVKDCRSPSVLLTAYYTTIAKKWRTGDGFHFSIHSGSLLRCNTADCIDAEEIELVPPEGEARLSCVDDDFVYADGYIYLTDGARIARLAVSGDGALEVLYRCHAHEVRALAVHRDRLYWSEGFAKDYGAIKSCPVAGCADAPTTALTTSEAAACIGVDDAHVYAVETVTPQNGNYEWQSEHFTVGDRLLRCPGAGCSEPTVLVANAELRGRWSKTNSMCTSWGATLSPTLRCGREHCGEANTLRRWQSWGTS